MGATTRPGSRRGGRVHIGIVTAALAALLALAIWALAPSSEQNRGPSLELQTSKRPANHEQVDPEGAPSDLVESTRPQATAVSGSAPEDRRPLAAQEGLGGTLLTKEGTPVAGATVSMTLWDEALDLRASPPFAPPTDLIATRSTLVVTGPTGRFFFPEAAQVPPETWLVIWCTHPDYLAKSLVLSPEDQANLEPLEIKLEAPPTSMVAFVSLDGEPLEGAEVLQRVAPRQPFEPAFEGRPDPRLAFLRRVTTQADGTARLAPTDFAQEVSAEARMPSTTHLVSTAWQGMPKAEIPLELAASFFVEGSVEDPDSIIQEGYAPTITFWATVKQERTLLGSVGPLSEDELGFGPVVLPALPMDGLIARLEAQGVATVELPLPPALPGQTIQVVLGAQAGHYVRLDLVDSNKNPASNGWVHLKWNAGTHQVETDGVQTALGTFVASCPEGTIQITAGAPGFAVAQPAPAEFPANDPGYWIEVQLAPSRQLSGTCLLDGKPAPDFTLRYWHDVRPSLRSSVPFKASPDGQFRIPDAPIGTLSVMALGPDLERSELVTVGPDDTAPITLHLLPVRNAIGRVVDPEGAPIEGATVTLSTAQVSRALDPIGEPASSAPDGSFELPGVGLGLNYLQVEASGYGAVSFNLKATEEGPLDYGTITLDRLAQLTVEVKAPGEVTHGVAPYLGTLDPAVLPMTLLEDDGSTTLDGIAPGQHYFQVAFDSGLAQLKPLEVTPGAASPLQFDLNGDFALTVSVENKAGKDDSVFVDLHHFDPFGVEVDTTFYLTENEPYTLTGFGPGLVKATAQSVATGFEGKGSLIVKAGEATGQLHLVVQALEPRARIVDAQGAPVAGADIMLYPEGGVGADIFARSDASGVCLLPELPSDIAFATIYGPTGVVAQGLAFTPAPDGSPPVDVILAPSTSLGLTVLVDGTPKAGVQAQLSELHRSMWIHGAKTTSAGGQTTFKLIAPGTYKLSVWGEGIWSRVTEVPIGASVTERTVKVHATTNATLEVLFPDGLPASGVSIDLSHLELQEGPAEWLDQGLITSANVSLTTDAKGKLTLKGLPTGSYTWHIGSSSGTLDLGPDPNHVVLTLP